MAMVVRKARISDAEAIAKVHVQSWRETYPGIVSEEYLKRLSVKDREAAWSKNLEDQSERFNFVAENTSVGVVGFSSGGPLRGEAQSFAPALPENAKAAYDGEFYAIYLLKAFQKSGSGRALFEAVVKELKQRGFKSMLVWVLKDNPACAFYEAMGGRLLGQTKITIDKELDELAYGWESLG
jgi:GNAT superfamily N-acetyltransferase